MQLNILLEDTTVLGLERDNGPEEIKWQNVKVI